MTTAVYTLDQTIADFFSASTTCTRQQCDAFVVSQTGLDPQPVPLQGMFSYTVSAGPDKIFQFRAASSPLDMDLLRLAGEVHAQFVPRCREHGMMGEDEWWRVRVYEMERREGVAYVLARDVEIPQPEEAITSQRRTVQDLAKHDPLHPPNIQTYLN